ncbi:MAG: hypothetical protein BROFUL_01410 [Candidatus Brocadia fulgida]|uniref:Uncharacterized protein n=1 Tax=Candidatus Brocadia fulgida TaxID=380242 RepID=A0A0M2UY05_9BACT|nr:MAG: hypothetical protein BROFUL_01410 [Candidatus Brocadia fulgida]
MKYRRAGIFGTFVLFVVTTFSSSNIYAKEDQKESGWTIGADNRKTLYSV